MKQAVILIDDDIKYDKRIQKQINFFKKNNFNIKIIKCELTDVNIKKYSSIKFFVLNFFLIIKSLLYFKKLRKYTVCKNKLFPGFSNIVIKYIHAKKLGLQLNKSNIEVIYANDLFCGLLGMFVKTYKKNIYFIYDAHEVEFNRNREKNGLMRILYEIYLEKRIVTIADKIIVVNKPIKKLYENIYDIKEDKINIVNNNHFKYHYGFYKKNFKYGNIGILYIGKGVKGRLLEKLGYEADKMNIPIYSFFLGNIPDVAKKYKWYIGIKEYENKVKEIIKENTLLMWCVNEANCLSYKLALPNKFFQAIAFGMPVIAYKGTYLAEIVKKFNLGYIYEDNLKKIIEQIANKKNFFKIIENVENFQKLISEEKIVL